MKREPISSKLRFEILLRDRFTCQWCGARAPDVRLEVDHVHPVALGGENDPTNLLTACWPCNRGKSASSVGISDHVSRVVFAQEVCDAARAKFGRTFPQSRLFPVLLRLMEIEDGFSIPMPHDWLSDLNHDEDAERYLRGMEGMLEWWSEPEPEPISGAVSG